MQSEPRFNGRYIEGAGATRLFVEEIGDPTRPAILWIHGFAQSRLCWERQFASDLAEQFYLVRFDNRGHGLSDQPDDIAAYQQSQTWADDINAIITTLRLTRPVLCGWSYGGVIMCDYIRHYGSQHLAGLIFVDAISELGGQEHLARLGPEFVSLIPGFFSTDFSTGSLALQRLTAMVTHQLLNPYDFHFFLDCSAITTPVVRRGLFQRHVSSTELLKNLTLPTLIIQGQDDRIILPTYATYLAHHITDATLINYAQCGHAPFFEYPTRFNQDIAAFVQAL